MLLQCLPPSFCSIRLKVPEQITIEDFQDGRHGHMDDGWTMVNRPQHKLAWSKAPGELTIEDLQDGSCGGHLGYCNKMFLAILDHHIVPMPPTKFWLNLTYHSGADEVWRFSRWPPWGPSQILDQNDFSNSESLCHTNASHQVWVQSEMSFEEFQDGHCHRQLWCLNGMNLAVLNLQVSPMPPTKF